MIHIAGFFIVIALLVFFVLFQIVQAWRFARRADQLSRSASLSGVKKALHINDCAYDLPVILGNTDLFICEECFPYWQKFGAIVDSQTLSGDKRGPMPPLKYQGPKAEAA